MSQDPIRRHDTETKGVYRHEGAPGAEMTFSKAGANLIIIDHTDVPDAYRGQRIGEQLVARAVADARAGGHKILPLCPFAAATFRKHPEWSDVLSS